MNCKRLWCWFMSLECNLGFAFRESKANLKGERFSDGINSQCLGLNAAPVFFPKVIQWCTHHKDDPPPPEDDENKEKRTDDIPVWDQEFLKVDQGTLFELILVNVVFRLQLFSSLWPVVERFVCVWGIQPLEPLKHVVKAPGDTGNVFHKRCWLYWS